MGLFVIVGALLYFLPAMAALSRGHANAGAILIINIFLGWTLVGWVIALAWAFGNQAQPTVIETPMNAVPNISLPAQDSKTCPACAETVRLRATICRFCQYDFTAAGSSP